MRGIKVLVEWNIISKSRERKKDAKWLNNRYVLLDKSVWKEKPSRCEPLGNTKSQVANEGVAKSQIEASQVAVSDTKVAHTKDTHIEGYTSSLQSVALQEDSNKLESKDGVKELFDVWHLKGLLQNYGNKTHRQCAKDLIAKYGLDGAKKLAEYSVSILGQEYAPTINNPYELKNKLSALKAHIEKQKNKKANYIKL